MGEHKKYKCPTCKGEAPRQWAGQGFGFDFASGNGTPQANSGVAKHDYPTADQVVGKSADDRWAVMRERNKVKGQIRGSGQALARKDFLEEGSVVSEYTSLDKTTFDARKKLEGKFKDKAERDGVDNPVK